jgi:hypothetical protein
MAIGTVLRWAEGQACWAQRAQEAWAELLAGRIPSDVDENEVQYREAMDRIAEADVVLTTYQASQHLPTRMQLLRAPRKKV